MIITKENYKDAVPDKDQGIIYGLLIDIEDINNSREGLNLRLDIQDYHNEYSNERTEPCVDYYGAYSITTPNERLVYELSAEELDIAIWAIYKFNEIVK